MENGNGAGTRNYYWRDIPTCTVRRQLHIKCGVAKSCPGTHTGLQAPMLQTQRCDRNTRRNNLRFLHGTVTYKNLQDVNSFELFITN